MKYRTYGGVLMILEKLISIICDEFGADEEEINEDTLIEDIIDDELDTEDLVLTLEREFGVEFGSEISGDISIAELADMIEETVA